MDISGLGILKPQNVDSTKQSKSLADLFATTGPAKTAKSSASAISLTQGSGQNLSSYYSTSLSQLAAQEMSTDDAGSVTEAPVSTSSAVDDFRDFMSKSPAERMVDQILKSMGISEEDLKNMTPEQHKAVMDKVAEIMKEKMREASGVASQGNDTATASLS